MVVVLAWLYPEGLITPITLLFFLLFQSILPHHLRHHPMPQNFRLITICVRPFDIRDVEDEIGDPGEMRLPVSKYHLRLDLVDSPGVHLLIGSKFR